MADLFFLPFRPAFDSNAKMIPGAQAYFTLEGTNTPTPIYEDEALTIPLSNPVVANATGRFPAIYMDEGVSYRVRLYDADAVAGVDSPIEDYDPYTGIDDVSTLISDLADDTDPAHGAGMVGYGSGLGYASDTVGSHIDKLYSRDLGALPSGTTQGLNPYITFEGDPDGTTDLRNVLAGNQLEGAEDAAMSVVLGMQNEVRSTGGTLSFQYGIQGFNRLGRLGSTTGDVLTSRGIEWHIANEGSGHINEAFTFYAQGIDLADGTGTVDTVNSFRSGDIGNNTSRITTASYGFFQANCTSGASGPPILAAFGTDMSNAAGKWTCYFTGGAPTFHRAGIRIGGATPTAPTYQLDVVGKIRAFTEGGTVADIGYGVTAGGSATQLTSKSTAVTLNGKACGQITMNNAALAATALVAFTFNNDQIEADDEVSVWVKSGNASNGTYRVWAEGNGTGARTICVENRSGGSLSETLVLGFRLFKVVIT